jgi:hypothetical protein
MESIKSFNGYDFEKAAKRSPSIPLVKGEEDN